MVVTAETAATTQPGNIAGLLQDAAARAGDRPAVLSVRGEPVLRFGELAERAARIAAALAARDVGPGHCVLALVPRVEDFAVVAAGALWAGATLVVPPRTRRWRDALQLAAATAPDAVIAGPPLWPLVATVPRLRQARVRVAAGRWPLPGVEPLSALLAAASCKPRAVGPDEAALVSFTTGSTGGPKPVVRTHRVVWAQHLAMTQLRPPVEGDVDLVGLAILALHDLAAGVPVVGATFGGSRAGIALRQAAVAARATRAAGFPSFLHALVESSGTGSLDRLRSVHVGGAQVRASLLQRLAVSAPRAEATIVYGATEAEPIAAIDGREYLELWGRAAGGGGTCVGRPIDGTHVAVSPVTIAGKGRSPSGDRGLHCDGVGRLLVRGPHVAAPGWLDTGDVGRIDDAGRIWLLGRSSNVVAGTIFPGEVEPAVETVSDGCPAALVHVAGRGIVAVEVGRHKGRQVWVEMRRAVAASLAERGWGDLDIALLKELPRDARSGSKVDYARLAQALEREGPVNHCDSPAGE